MSIMSSRRRRTGQKTVCLKRTGRETGSASLELAIIMPAVLLMIFAGIQIANYFFARSLAVTAAQVGVDTARVDGGNINAGRNAAQRFLDENGSDSILGVSITTQVSPAEIRIRITGRAQSIMPGLPGMRVDQEARAPIERTTTD